MESKMKVLKTNVYSFLEKETEQIISVNDLSFENVTDNVKGKIVRFERADETLFTDMPNLCGQLI